MSLVISDNHKRNLMSLLYTIHSVYIVGNKITHIFNRTQTYLFMYYIFKDTILTIMQMNTVMTLLCFIYH